LHSFVAFRPKKCRRCAKLFFNSGAKSNLSYDRVP